MPPIFEDNHRMEDINNIKGDHDDDLAFGGALTIQQVLASETSAIRYLTPPSVAGIDAGAIRYRMDIGDVDGAPKHRTV